MFKNENLTVEVDGNISVDDLVGLRADGFDVTRSAHVGNLSAYNLTLAEAGIPLLLVDHNQTGRDTNYFPELVMSRAAEEQIAPLGKIVCRTAVDDGQYLDQVHVSGIVSALPGADVVTNTEYVRQNVDIAEATVAAAEVLVPDLFNRITTDDGIMQRISNGRFAGAEIMQLADDPRAEKIMRVLPNVVDVVIGFAVQARESGRETIYHISGPDMVKYFKGEAELVSRLYAQVAALPGMGDLPKSLDVKIVPGSSAVFATTKSKEAELLALEEAIVELVAYEESSGQERKAFFTGPSAKDAGARQEIIGRINGTLEELRQSIVLAAAEIPEITKGPRNPKFVTQYDVAREGLVVAGINRTLTFEKLNQMRGLIVQGLEGLS
jgi:hypothetical protein